MRMLLRLRASKCMIRHGTTLHDHAASCMEIHRRYGISMAQSEATANVQPMYLALNSRHLRWDHQVHPYSSSLD